MDLFHTDLTYFADRVPVVKDIGTIFFAVGWALLIGNLVFQAMRSMMSGVGICHGRLQIHRRDFSRLAPDVCVHVRTDGIQSGVCQAADQRNVQCTERHGHYPVDDAGRWHCPHGKKDGRHYFAHRPQSGPDRRSTGYAFPGDAYRNDAAQYCANGHTHRGARYAIRRAWQPCAAGIWVFHAARWQAGQPIRWNSWSICTGRRCRKRGRRCRSGHPCCRFGRKGDERLDFVPQPAWGW